MTLSIEWGGLHTVISGGQTGADQGGLMAAWKMDVRTGGLAPAHFKTSNGYNPLLELIGLTAGGDYASRTKVNVKESDGTVIIAYDLKSTGSLLTAKTCQYEKKPVLLIEVTKIIKLAQLGPEVGVEAVMTEIVAAGTTLKNFIVQNHLQVLNVAGNRELPPSGERYGHLVMTNTSEWVVSVALEMLGLDGKLIRKV